MVNWKTAESQTRLIAALLAASPTLKLDYNAIAVVYGEGAKYDSIEHQFRKYRKQAEDLRREATEKGISPERAPRTPRGPRSGIMKSSSASSTGRSNKGIAKTMKTPTKKGRLVGEHLMDAILIDDDDDDSSGSDTESKPGIKIKKEVKSEDAGTAGIIPSIENPDLLSTATSPPRLLSGVVISRRSQAPSREYRSAPKWKLPTSASDSRSITAAPGTFDADGDKYMGDERDTFGYSPGKRRRARDRATCYKDIPFEGYTTDSTNGETA
ncbi:hypothetical protein BJX99DRAFT_258142 [Aspergillus californicus]